MRVQSPYFSVLHNVWTHFTVHAPTGESLVKNTCVTIYFKCYYAITMTLGRIKKLPFIPKVFSYTGTRLLVDFIDNNNDIKDIFQIIQKRISEKTIGLSVGEIPDEEHLLHILKKSDVALKITDITNTTSKKTVGVINIEPQHICRSAAPITHGGYVIMDSYKDIKPGKDMLAMKAMCGRASG